MINRIGFMGEGWDNSEFSPSSGRLADRVFKKVEAGSELALIADHSDQISQEILKKVDDTSSHEKKINATTWPLENLSLDQRDDDSFEDELVEGFHSENGSAVYEDQEQTLWGVQKEEGIVQKEEGIVQKEEVSQEQNIKREEAIKKNPKLEELSKRVVPADKIDGLRFDFRGDLAMEFESKKPNHVKFHNEGAHVYAGHFNDLNIKAKNDIDIELMAKRALALLTNKREKIEEISVEDVEKAIDKANDLLHPNLIDKQGRPIKNELFLLIKARTRKNVGEHLISQGFIEKTKKNEEDKSTSTKLTPSSSLVMADNEDASIIEKRFLGLIIKNPKIKKQKVDNFMFEGASLKEVNERKREEKLEELDRIQRYVIKSQIKAEGIIKQEIKEINLDKSVIRKWLKKVEESRKIKEKIKISNRPNDLDVFLMDNTRDRRSI